MQQLSLRTIIYLIKRCDQLMKKFRKRVEWHRTSLLLLEFAIEQMPASVKQSMYVKDEIFIDSITIDLWLPSTGLTNNYFSIQN